MLTATPILLPRRDAALGLWRVWVGMLQAEFVVGNK